jgi:hypothetical protein
MSLQSKPVDFKQIVQEIKQDKRYGEKDLAIWGGLCMEAELSVLLESKNGVKEKTTENAESDPSEPSNLWKLTEMPFRLWGYTSWIDFQSNTLPTEISLLERGRLFGEGGDLTIRRDCTNFRWHFVGKSGLRPPKACKAEDFWVNNKEITFHRNDEIALLWGECSDPNTSWFDSRVGQAILNYPVSKAWKRVQIQYWAFSRVGRIEFVWLRGLKEWKA